MTFKPLQLFLLATAVVEAVLALLSFNNDSLAIASGCIVSVQAFCGLILITSVLFLHLAYDLANKGLYRVSLWAFLFQLILVTSLQLKRPGTVSSTGMFVATVAAIGFAWLTAEYRKNLYPNKAAPSAGAAVEKPATEEAKKPARGRSRSPRSRK